MRTHFLLASDFDQTLSFNDSGQVLSELVGISDFEAKVHGLSASHLVQQGAELSYLLRHDPEFRVVRREHLLEAGKRVRLKHDVALLAEILKRGMGTTRFSFFVISASPRLLVQSALEGILPPEQVFGTELAFAEETGEIAQVKRVPAGYGKVAVLQEIEQRLGTTPERTIYVGDGSSDLYVMHHVNSCDGHTIAVSETLAVGRVAERTVLSDSAISVLLPIMEDVLGWNAPRVRELFASHGYGLQGWDKIRTDFLTFRRELPSRPSSRPVPVRVA
jgi:HAD superfamily phosphoserine phosphatase-like hydrolase